MDQQFSLLSMIFAVSTSFVGSLVFFWYLRGREKRIKTKIAEIQYEEEFLDKIKAGNIELIRSGFRTICFSLFLVFTSVALLLADKFLPWPQVISHSILGFSIAMWGAAAAINFSYFRSLVRLHDVKESKKKLAEKREKLGSKL